MPKFKIGDIVNHTFPPYLTGVSIIEVWADYNPPMYMLHRSGAPLMVSEVSIELTVTSFRSQPKLEYECEQCKGTGTITLFTSIVQCECRVSE